MLLKKIFAKIGNPTQKCCHLWVISLISLDVIPAMAVPLYGVDLVQVYRWL